VRKRLKSLGQKFISNSPHSPIQHIDELESILFSYTSPVFLCILPFYVAFSSSRINSASLAFNQLRSRRREWLRSHCCANNSIAIFPNYYVVECIYAGYIFFCTRCRWLHSIDIPPAAAMQGTRTAPISFLYSFLQHKCIV
jgi:hypothetical protein